MKENGIPNLKKRVEGGAQKKLEGKEEECGNDVNTGYMHEIFNKLISLNKNVGMYAQKANCV